MAAQQPDYPMQYEYALRVIGRHLDAEPAYHVGVFEMPDGFTVRYSPSQDRSNMRTLHLTWDRIQDLNVFQTAGRGLNRKHGRHQGLWTNIPGGHLDFFRALGSLLDEIGGSNLTVDEVADGIAISYLHPSSENAVKTEKYHSILGEAEINELVETARQKREAREAAVPEQSS